MDRRGGALVEVVVAALVLVTGALAVAAGWRALLGLEWEAAARARGALVAYDRLGALAADTACGVAAVVAQDGPLVVSARRSVDAAGAALRARVHYALPRAVPPDSVTAWRWCP